jgi:hypothetical protein
VEISWILMRDINQLPDLLLRILRLRTDPSDKENGRKFYAKKHAHPRIWVCRIRHNEESFSWFGLIISEIAKKGGLRENSSMNGRYCTIGCPLCPTILCTVT